LSTKSDELFGELLYEMGSSLGFTFDKVQIAKKGYSPQYHNTIETEAGEVRRLLIEWLSGQRAANLNVVGFPDMDDSESQKELVAGMGKLLEASLSEKEPEDIDKTQI